MYKYNNNINLSLLYHEPTLICVCKVCVLHKFNSYLKAIRLAIEQRVMDDLKSKESAWVRSVIPPDVDVASVLKVLTTER